MHRQAMSEADTGIGTSPGRQRMLAGEHLGQHDANGVDVGARVDGAAEQLLGRHVRRRADDVARSRQSGR